MTDPIGMEAAAFYYEVSKEMSAEAQELEARNLHSSANHVSELAAIALCASYQEVNPHDAPDVPWCTCQTCQKFLFAMRWARTTRG